jgi:hypothetical protein
VDAIAKSLKRAVNDVGFETLRGALLAYVQARGRDNATALVARYSAPGKSVSINNVPRESRAALLADFEEGMP